MHTINTRTATRLVAVALCLAIFPSCKKKDAPAVDTSAALPAPAPAPAAAALSVNGIETGKGINPDKTVKDDAHDFGVRDTVYVSVKTEGAGTGKLSAKFTYQDGQTVAESSQDISTTGDAHHEFHVQKAKPWPKGDYKVDVMLNGTSVGTKDFTIK